MIKRYLVLIIIGSILFSCGSRRLKGIATKDAEAAGIIQQHYQGETDFETLSGRLRAVYQTEEKTQSINLQFRMKKDEGIWMNAAILGFPVARALITPQNVSYYEKVGKTYFDGDFRFLSDLLGTPLDFEKLQNLLIGQAIYDLREEEFSFSQTARGYQFQPMRERGIKKMFLIDPEHLKAQAQQLVQENDNRSLTITYSGYQEISGKLFPKDIKIVANEGNSNTHIELTYRNLEVDQVVNFPFEIPSGYDQIRVE